MTKRTGKGFALLKLVASSAARAQAEYEWICELREATRQVEQLTAALRVAKVRVEQLLQQGSEWD